MALVLFVSPVQAVELTFTTETTPKTEVTSTEKTKRASITRKQVFISEALLDENRVRKVVKFRGNKSVRFAEFENLALAPQQAYAKGLLNAEMAVPKPNVVNFAELPNVNDKARAVKKVETKVTARTHDNPAITGYGRSRGGVYGSLRLKRAKDAKTDLALQAKLNQFQANSGRVQEKLAFNTDRSSLN